MSTLCILGNFALLFSKSASGIPSEYYSVLDPDQARPVVGADLGSTCSQRLSEKTLVDKESKSLTTTRNWQISSQLGCRIRLCGSYETSGPKVIKLFSCSTQLSTKFQLLIKTKIPTNGEVSCFKSLICCNYYANKY